MTMKLDQQIVNRLNELKLPYSEEAAKWLRPFARGEKILVVVDFPEHRELWQVDAERKISWLNNREDGTVRKDPDL